MKIDDIKYGFRIVKITEVPEISATVYEMIYEKNGCKLLWLDRPDDNKTFAITFKTIPEDNTGVFHILEHSVLCGSDKYPLKEPFVDLLKSSMQTFLNAMTFLDKTMYPVSSKNDKDLLNLMDVYLDAVFNPLIYSKKEIFMQEGWHIEEEEDGSWKYNGVVYNEMKGVFSSVDNTMIYKVMEKLFPDNCYGWESGGNPANIPELTYEQFIETHKKFYHPSNANIVLDGKVNLDMTLPLIASYLEKYEAKEVNFDIPVQDPVSPEVSRIKYEIAEDDDAKDKTEIAKGYVFADFTQKKDCFAASILCEILSGSNDSPLKKALFSKGLADDVYFTAADDTKQRASILVLRGVPQGREEEAEKVIVEEISKLIEEGVPEDQLVADINIVEFTMKEQDFGSTPAGLIFAMKLQESWLHGGNPEDALAFSDCFAQLRESIGTPYYEDLLKRMFIENDHQATIYMIPDVNLADENRAKMKATMDELRSNASEEYIAIMKAENEKLEIFQGTPDTPELSALVPHLDLADISEDVTSVELVHGKINGVKTITAIRPINDIIYTDLLFDLSGFTAEELWIASAISNMLGQTRTENYTALEYSTLAKTYLGSLSTSVPLTSEPMNLDSCIPFFRYSVGALLENQFKIAELLEEKILRTIFDEDRVVETLKQDKLSYETSLKESGNRHASAQVRACLSSLGAVNEILSGETSYNYILKHISEPDKLVKELDRIMKKIFNRNRLVACIVGKENNELLESIIEFIPAFEDNMDRVVYERMSEKEKKIEIASDVSYAAKAINLYNYMPERKGEISVATKMLSLEYLWNEVRVKGGAYGCSCGSVNGGDIVFSSYRDPNPENTLNIYDGAGDALRRMVDDTDDLTKYIIGTISAIEVLRSPYSEGISAITFYLNGASDEIRRKRRREILDTTKEKLLAVADLFDKIETDAAVCVVGKK